MSGGIDLLPVYRVTVFVPATHLQALLDGLCAEDDLRIGDYAHVLWIAAPGREQFRPLPGAAPAQGEIGRLEVVDSVRLEFCLPRDTARLARVIERGVRAHHPWETPAIFVDESMLPLPASGS